MVTMAMHPYTERIELVLKLRRAGIIDNQLVSAVERTNLAYFISPIPAAPLDNDVEQDLALTTAKTLQYLHLTPTSLVLEIGTGCGYFTALLAQCAKQVCSIDIHKDTYKRAEKLLFEGGYRNVICCDGDGLQGWPAARQFSHVVIHPTLSEPPATLLRQLQPGGVILLTNTPDRCQRRYQHQDSGLTMATASPTNFFDDFTQETLGEGMTLPLENTLLFS